MSTTPVDPDNPTGEPPDESPFGDGTFDGGTSLGPNADPSAPVVDEDDEPGHQDV